MHLTRLAGMDVDNSLRLWCSFRPGVAADGSFRSSGPLIVDQLLEGKDNQKQQVDELKYWMEQVYPWA